MPYKAQKYKIEDESLDRRKKLTKRNKLEIIALSNKAGLSQRALARMYNVSRRTIEATNELNGEFQEGWEEEISYGENMLEDLKSRKLCDKWIHSKRVEMNDDRFCPLCGENLK